MLLMYFCSILFLLYSYIEHLSEITSGVKYFSLVIFSFIIYVIIIHLGSVSLGVSSKLCYIIYHYYTFYLHGTSIKLKRQNYQNLNWNAAFLVQNISNERLHKHFSKYWKLICFAKIWYKNFWFISDTKIHFHWTVELSV